jgi:hypothetical protein
MLENLGEQVLDCLRRAEEAAERAKYAPNPSVRRDLLEMERRWLKLAQGYQFLDQFGVFTTYNKQGRAELSRRLSLLNRMLAKAPAETRGSAFKTTKKHILDQRLRIERQRELIAKLERDGTPDALADARWRLAMMEHTLARMEAEYTSEPENPLARDQR